MRFTTPIVTRYRFAVFTEIGRSSKLSHSFLERGVQRSLLAGTCNVGYRRGSSLSRFPVPMKLCMLDPQRGISNVSSLEHALSSTATIAEVCEWAGRQVGDRGAGLSDSNVSILLREEINGVSLFKLTDEKLKGACMTLGARDVLLAAVELLREPHGS
jgi:hypothetical protein